MGSSPVRIAALAGITLFIAHAPPVMAEALTKFCDIDTDKSCVIGFIKNRSSATVMSVDITQKGKHGCEKDERHFDMNLYGGWNEGRTFRTHLSALCRYEVKFNTTHGCTGHKRGTFSRQNLENRRHQLNLTGGCATLDTETVRSPFHHYDLGQPDSYPSDETETESDDSETDDS